MPEEKKALKPGFCCFGITDKCMLRCKMCEKWKGDLRINEAHEAPTIAQWQQCVCDLAKMVDLPFELDIGGGEALMHERLLEVVRFSVEKGFNTSIASNGYLIDKRMAKRIAGSGLKAISISLDSLNEDVHDYLRGVKSVYRRAMAAIDLLHRHCKGIVINLCCVLYEMNQDTVLDLVEWAHNDARIASTNFMAAMQPNNTTPEDRWWSGKYGSIWPKDNEKTIRVIQEIIDKKINGYKIGNPLSQLKAFQAYYKNPASFVKSKQCNLERCVLVSSVGDIFLCYDFPSIGNIKKDRLIDVWYCSQAEEVRKEISRCNKNCHHLLNCFDEFEADFPANQ